MPLVRKAVAVCDRCVASVEIGCMFACLKQRQTDWQSSESDTERGGRSEGLSRSAGIRLL